MDKEHERAGHQIELLPPILRPELSLEALLSMYKCSLTAQTE